MTVYKRPDSRFYRFDFVLRGTRYTGSTERTTKREAESVERKFREEARRLLAAGKAAADSPTTLEQACGRYWIEVGQHTVASNQTLWSTQWLIRELGADKPIRDIGNDDVARIVARRRSEPADNVMAARKQAKGGKVRSARRLAPGTVNRSVTEPLRRILKRAADLWGESVQPIRWKEHKLAEPKERVRFASEEEEAAIFAVLPPCYQALVRFALLSGCRASECCRLTWSDVAWHERRIGVIGKGKAGAPKHRAVPLTAEMESFLRPLRGNAAAGAAIFRNASGEPVSYRSYYAAFVTACRRAGVKNLRVHDLRHTAATRILRSTGNLRMAQKLLGHEDIATTARYAHVLDDDLRDAMEAMARTKSPPESPTGGM